jgi:hypothetical protein
MSFFKKILLWATRHGNSLTFGLLWITVTAAVAIYVSRAVYRERGEPLLSYRSYPPIPHWLLHLLFDSLPIGPQTRIRYYALSDRWGDASVTKWK